MLPRFRFQLRGQSSTFLAGLSLVLVVVLSGCAGSSGPANASGPAGIQSSSGPAPTFDPSCPGCAAGEEGKLDPKRHHHHYWGENQEVTIFEGTLTFRPNVAGGQSETSEFTNNLDEGCRSVGFVQWDLEDDGDDVNHEQLAPINPDTKRADTIFAGADSLRVDLQSIDSTILGIGFKYRPGNLNFFQPDSGQDQAGTCGVQLEVGKPFQVTVGPGQADPPHQYFASRWEFKAYSLKRLDGNSGDLPTAGQGSFKIKIVAHNGGENSLDPAHPDLYGDGGVYDLGCTEEIQVDRQLIAAPLLKPRGALTDIKWPDGRIVPLLTEKVVVTLDVKYTGAVAGTTAELWFHGSNTTKYTKAPASGTSGTATAYEIPDPLQILADPPYEYRTLWRFEIHPKGPGNVDATEFSGTLKLCAEAHKVPGAILT